MDARRLQFEPAATAHQPPSVLRGDELAQTTFWHGKLLRERARRWVDYQTRGAATYALTAMEDAGIVTALEASPPPPASTPAVSSSHAPRPTSTGSAKASPPPKASPKPR